MFDSTYMRHLIVEATEQKVEKGLQAVGGGWQGGGGEWGAVSHRVSVWYGKNKVSPWMVVRAA